MIEARFSACNVGGCVICLYCNLIFQQCTPQADDLWNGHKHFHLNVYQDLGSIMLICLSRKVQLLGVSKQCRLKFYSISILNDDFISYPDLLGTCIILHKQIEDIDRKNENIIVSSVAMYTICEREPADISNSIEHR